MTLLASPWFRWPRWRKAAVAAVVALVGLLALYVVAANVLLSSGEIAHLVSKDPEKLRLGYSSARTFWPGRVHVEGFELRGRDAHTEWQLRVDTVDADLSLLALLRHRFHTGSVTARGVTFRARFRLEPGSVNEDRVARMPPIDGFEAVPLVGSPPDEDGGKGKPWIIDVQGVDAQAVREVWIDAYRVAGDVHAVGGFTIGDGQLIVAPSSADVQATDLTTGDDAIATDVAGRLEARIEPVVLAEAPGAALLHYLSTRSELRGRMGGIRFMRHLIHDDAVVLSGGAGPFAGSVNVVEGLVKPGTTSHVELEPAAVTIDGHRIDARVRIDVTSGEDDAGTWCEAGVALRDVAFTQPGARSPAVASPALTARARVQQLGLTGAPKDFAYSWDAPHIETRDLHALEEVLPKDSPFHVERGEGSLSTHGSGDLLRVRGEATIDGNLVARIQGARVASGIRATVPMSAVLVGERGLDLGGTKVALTDPAAPGWWANVDLGTLAIHFEPSSVALSASTSARDGRPFLDFYSALEGTSPVARTALGIVPNPMIESMTANLRGTGRVAVSKGAMHLDDLDVRGASSRLRGTLDKRGERMNGGLLLEAGPTALGISFTEGKTGVVLVDAPRWYETQVSPVAVR